ncbi:Inositol polyphosphate phosphatase, catalytic domain ues [Orobanche minor]
MKKQNTRNRNPQSDLSWRRVVFRKWLNIANSNSDYSADSDSDSEPGVQLRRRRFLLDPETCDWPRDSRFRNEKPDEVQVDANASDALPRTRRRKSETFRAQYISTKEIRVCAATWNVGGLVPPDDLDLGGWLDIDDPADIYVIGLQEIIPLNAGNIFGVEDNRPVSKWEMIIRENLNQVPPLIKFKSFSDPPSPSKFKPPEDAPNIEETVLESDSEVEGEIYPLNEESNVFAEVKAGTVTGENLLCADNLTNSVEQEFKRQFSSQKMLHMFNCLKPEDSEENTEALNTQYTKQLTKSLSGRERIGLSWPEPPLHLLAQHGFDKPNSFKSSKSVKSFRTYNSFKSNTITENRMRFDLASLAEIDLESLINRKRRPPYVRIVSKQMVGIFITIWVHRCLRRHIQNLNVSTVGVGVMGYIGNKIIQGSISVSMSVHQTLFCFICTHLTSGDKETDIVKRNADVLEIHKRTRFNSLAGIGLPRSIYDHERIIWLGDLNYRISLPYERTRELISKKDWSMLLERDQLVKELRKGRAFDGWSEGTLNFPPTYKYELNSESYCGEDPKAGRRTPAWERETIHGKTIGNEVAAYLLCDRILSFGRGMKLLSYRRSELKLSDHRPLTATYMVEVEVFSPRKLQRALTFTDAEIEEQDNVTEIGPGGGMLRLEEDVTYWGR